VASPQDHLDNIVKYREYYNKELSDIGFQAPTPKAGQKGGNYRRQSLQTFADSLLPQLHELAKVDYFDIPYDTVKILEPQVLRACVTEYQNPNNVPPGELREIIKIHPQSGHKMNLFIGREHFVKQMPNYRPGRRVVSFKTDQGFVDASGRGLR
jgi:hypothetical protein